ncbi:mandelate racemase/muconate lactonizing enzyme family protein [Pelagibacterium montanilacus]|uniref:mandelate racemase/muconate lactonizing enzyme family protein n=1 Tax=Pelagibacterium montanilacus TaxID=2185280 RepID=UPI000F8F44AD|nr:mandelate racemase/muconate lactonizing enzyme family protein [Pelagibacterium montanilacus]
MKITGIRTTRVAVPLPGPIANATARIDTISCVLVHLDTESGATGEGLVFSIRPGHISLLEASLAMLIPDAIGLRVDQSERFVTQAMAAMSFLSAAGAPVLALSAIESAMWDARGKIAGMSVSSLLGRSRDAVPVYASSGLWTNQGIEDIVEQARHSRDSGFAGVKLRLAGSPDFDLPRLEAVRRAIGQHMAIMVDVNQGMDAAAAISLGRMMEPYAIAWFEEPVPVHDPRLTAHVKAALDVPVAIGESEFTHHGISRVLTAGAADILMPDLQRMGGVAEFMRAGAMAGAAGVPVSSHLFPEMSLHLMASLPNASLLEHVDWFAPLYREQMEIADGHCAVPDRPGWGFSFDQDAIERYSV